MTLACPVPATATDRVQLGHGSGGKMSAALIRDRFLPHFANDVLAQLGDAAVVDVGGGVEAEAAVAVLVVVPAEEFLAVSPGVLDRGEPAWEIGPVLEGRELRF